MVVVGRTVYITNIVDSVVKHRDISNPSLTMA